LEPGFIESIDVAVFLRWGISLPVPTSLEYGHMCLWRIDMATPTPDPVAGTRFGRLTIKDGIAVRKGRDKYFAVVCDCGKENFQLK
jgi:hypothetical protein